MVAQDQQHDVVYRVIDALDAPHGGRILRLRLKAGKAPRARDLKDARMLAVSPDGEERMVEVEGFALVGGKATDERLARTGRADLRVHDLKGDSGSPIDFDWELVGPLD